MSHSIFISKVINLNLIIWPQNQSDMFVYHNEKFFKSTQLSISPYNRALLYGDSLLESMRWHKGKLLFLQAHINRLQAGIQALQLTKPEWIQGKNKSATNAQFFLQGIVSKLVKKNKITGDARIRLQLYRADGGMYQPQKNDCELLVEASALSDKEYVLNSIGLYAGIYREATKVNSIYSPFKSGNMLLYVLAANQARNQKLDDILITNPYGRLLEGSSSNLFIRKGKVISFPPVNDGCTNGIMRSIIPKLCIKVGYKCIEKSITEKILFSADEVFLTNAVRGIRWVKRIGTNNYVCEATPKLIHELNAEINT